MASLTFYFSSMNAGKSMELIKTYFNFKSQFSGSVHSEKDNVICLTSAQDNRSGVGKIASRPLQTTLEAHAIPKDLNLKDFLLNEVMPSMEDPTELILVDEAQFFTEQQIRDLAYIVDSLNIDVMCYGLRSDFKAQPFEGSLALLTLSDKLREVKNRCVCGKKATMNLRFDENFNVVNSGESIQVGGEENYISLCRKHFFHAHEIGDVHFLKHMK
tara:strand:- start:20724 stop:21368 length:645 start_codon:yes stop_codon:yes gene_type:complete